MKKVLFWFIVLIVWTVTSVVIVNNAKGADIPCPKFEKKHKKSHKKYVRQTRNRLWWKQQLQKMEQFSSIHADSRQGQNSADIF
jgi:hypothetical protein